MNSSPLTISMSPDVQAAQTRTSTWPTSVVSPHARHESRTGTWSISSAASPNEDPSVTRPQQYTRVSGTTWRNCPT